jgi:hypothetical protein
MQSLPMRRKFTISLNVFLVGNREPILFHERVGKEGGLSTRRWLPACLVEESSSRPWFGSVNTHRVVAVAHAVFDTTKTRLEKLMYARDQIIGDPIFNFNPSVESNCDTDVLTRLALSSTHQLRPPLLLVSDLLMTERGFAAFKSNRSTL